MRSWILQLPLLFCVLSNLLVHATHVRSADLKLEPLCINGGLTYRVTVIVYLDNHGGVHTPAGTDASLNFGDGSGDILGNIAVTRGEFFTVDRPDLGTDISIATFITQHTFPRTGTYLVSYREGDRNDNILNITGSDDVDYITFIQFTIDPNNLCNNLPTLPVPPLDRACQQITFYHTSGAYDEDGDSLSYEMSIPYESRSAEAAYTSPINALFYPGIFNMGNEEDNGQPSLTIDAFSGLVSWNAPGTAGQYNIAFKIIEWRKDPVTGIYSKQSTTTRDMQIIVEQCTNKKPQLIIPQDTCVVAGAVIDKTIFGTDADLQKVKIEVFGLVIDLDADKHPATYSPDPAVFQSSNPRAQLNFHWQTDCIHVRNQTYQVVFKITDNPSSGPKLVSFKIWNIKIIAPAPVLQNTQIDIAQKRAILDWDTYTCGNAAAIQVWRKVGPYNFVPNTCEVGIPRSVGYNLIATLPANNTNFIDDNFGLGLSPGAVYCYRLVAYFDSPENTSSVVSGELCVGPVMADAPVITHVSVVQTAIDDGSIRVSWHNPMDINKVQFPPETYEYEIYRADDYVGEVNVLKVGRVTDTTFLETAINTKEKVFNYRIVLYAQPPLAVEKIPVDTSAVASSEWLTPASGDGLIKLAWRDSVPWSNVVRERPYHRIYRGIDDDDPAHMVLYDSVNVAETGFEYVDDGPLDDDRLYSYRVLTRGTYGNPAIKLQENYSQVVTSLTNSDLKPCAPVVLIDKVDCGEYLTGANCDQTTFANTISWSVKRLRGCRKNIAYYKIYYSKTKTDEFLFLTNVSDTFHIDNNLSSFARCYKISAVDLDGVESALSESSCNDNCPFFMLPNVFTPGLLDGLNDTFNANFDNGVVPNPDDVIIRCPRFVEQVQFQVFNRWGEKVYESTSGNGSSPNIEWKGIDLKGRELATGVYYYTAHVLFNVSDPEKRIGEYRGWVKLIR